jgi:CRISPR-associated protein Cmr4
MSTSSPRAEHPFVLFWYAETPTHVGSGSSLGPVDLPVQRERVTGLPTLPSSGLRGALREQVERQDREGAEDRASAWFGTQEGAGGVHLDDARLLLFPVRALRTGWVWLTSPMLLERLRRALAVDQQPVWVPADAVPPAKKGASPPAVPAVPAITAPGRALRAEGAGAVLIEDQRFEFTADPLVKAWAEWLRQAFPAQAGYDPFRARLPGQLLVVHDADLAQFARGSTEVVTRVRIDADTHTVASGALWTEELVPAETLYWSTGIASRHVRKERPKAEDAADGLAGGEREVAVDAAKVRGGLKAFLAGLPTVRIGGDQGIGRGRMGLRLLVPAGGGDQ